MYPRAASLPALRGFRLEHGAHSRNGAEDTVYRLTARPKKSHKSAAHRPRHAYEMHASRLYRFFTSRKEIEHRFDTRIPTLSHPILPSSVGWPSSGPMRRRSGAGRRYRQVPRVFRASKTKGESDVVDFGGHFGRALHLSVPCVDQAGTVLIRALQRKLEKNIGEPYERSAFRAVHARVLRVDGRFHQRPGQDLSERRHVQ